MANISTIDIKEVGIVREVKQGIVRIKGLPSCMFGGFVDFPNNVKGLIIEFNEKEVSAIVFGDEGMISIGDTVQSSSELINIPVGDGLVGRVVGSLAEPLDGKGPIAVDDRYPVFREAPGIMEREPIEKSLHTGVKSVDLTIPIGKGQRELIIGDRQTGKTSLCLDAIINQKGQDVICIYCWAGGSRSDLKKHLYILKQKGAMEYTIVTAATANTSIAERYLVPYTAATLGEYFMHKGKDVLIVFDDLTKHAWVYREMSLLLERSPGREAYPGDIFYLHSRLLERAGKLHPDLGGGSMTFLPIVETLQGDITGYIQTNLISITDGQIYISTPLFREGFKPAIDLSLSVSRIGSKVQCPAIREVGGGLRLEYSQYREMLRLTRLKTSLSDDAVEKGRRGKALQNLLVQPHSNPVPLEEEIALFYLFQRRKLEVLSEEDLKIVMNTFFDYFKEKDPQLVAKIGKEKELTEEVKKGIEDVFASFLRKTESASKENKT